MWWGMEYYRRNAGSMPMHTTDQYNPCPVLLSTSEHCRIISMCMLFVSWALMRLVWTARRLLWPNTLCRDWLQCGLLWPLHTLPTWSVLVTASERVMAEDLPRPRTLVLNLTPQRHSPLHNHTHPLTYPLTLSQLQPRSHPSPHHPHPHRNLHPHIHIQPHHQPPHLHPSRVGFAVATFWI